MLLKAVQLALILRGLDGGQILFVEVNRRLRELLKNEHHNPNEQNQKLHRHFYHAVEQQTQTAFGHGFARQITLHLRLVGAEITQKQECAAEHTRPKIVAVLPKIGITPIEFEGNDIDFAQFTRRRHRIAERNIGR